MAYGQKSVVVQAEAVNMAGIADTGMLEINWKKRPVAGVLSLIWIDGEPVSVAKITNASQLTIPLPKGAHRLSGGSPRERKVEITVDIAAGQMTCVKLEYGTWWGKIRFGEPVAAGPISLDEASLTAAIKTFANRRKLAAAAATVLKKSNASLRVFSDRVAVVYKPSWFSVIMIGGLFGGAACDAASQKHIFEVEPDGSVTCRMARKKSDVPGVY